MFFADVENNFNLIVYRALAYFSSQIPKKGQQKSKCITTGYSDKHLGQQKHTNYRKHLPEGWVTHKTFFKYFLRK